ncbi:hypothetical protein, partial [Deinococcus sedimenti]|uniref:hypothetical protein n=1 Tax=Deinococcus sedimenti TaxID=1867090 RepID=UPI001E33905D
PIIRSGILRPAQPQPEDVRYRAFDYTLNQWNVIDSNNVIKAALTLGGTVRYTVLTRATLPFANGQNLGGAAGAAALVSDPAAGKSAPVWSDGAIWRYVGANSVV